MLCASGWPGQPIQLAPRRIYCTPSPPAASPCRRSAQQRAAPHSRTVRGRRDPLGAVSHRPPPSEHLNLMTSVSESDERTLDEAEPSTTTSHGTTRLGSPDVPLSDALQAASAASAVMSSGGCKEAKRGQASDACTCATQSIVSDGANGMHSLPAVDVSGANNGDTLRLSEDRHDGASGKSSSGGPGGLLAGLAAPFLRTITGAARRPPRSQSASPAPSHATVPSAAPSLCASPAPGQAAASSGHGSDALAAHAASGSTDSQGATRGSGQSPRSSDAAGPALDAASRLSSHAVQGLQSACSMEGALPVYDAASPAAADGPRPGGRDHEAGPEQSRVGHEGSAGVGHGSGRIGKAEQPAD